MIVKVSLETGQDTQSNPESLGTERATQIKQFETTRAGILSKMPVPAQVSLIPSSQITTLKRWNPSNGDALWVGFDKTSKQVITLKSIV
tara:strand:- start:22215 stop:22481 length:267 start_codon:yes stop_codon:yes gene_type:complete